MRFLLGVLLLSLQVCLGKVASGTIGTGRDNRRLHDGNFIALSNFVFQNNNTGDNTLFPDLATGYFEWTVRTQNQAGISLFMYSDEDHSWPSIFDADTGRYRVPGLSCADMTRLETQTVDGVRGPVKGIYQIATRAEGNATLFQFTRPRFWYFALACCSCEANSLNGVSYELTMLNNQMGWGPWREQFGVDEEGLQTMFVLYLIFYLLYIPVHCYGMYQHIRISSNLHAFLKIFLAVIALEFFSIVFNVAHYLKFKSDGKGAIGSLQFGRFLEIVGRIVFLGLLLLLAEGWTITKVQIETLNKRIIAGTMTFFILTYMALIIWENHVQEPEMVRPPLRQRRMINALLVAWAIFAFWFISACIRSYKSVNPLDETLRPKRDIFFLLGVMFGTWILTLPIIDFSGTRLDPWVYQEFTQAANHTAQLIGLFMFTFLVWPSRAAKYFSQISVSAQELGGIQSRNNLLAGSDYAHL